MVRNILIAAAIVWAIASSGVINIEPIQSGGLINHNQVSQLTEMEK
jgi:Cys-tRNA synthase (O-phospho-L-seryl-tRNA:Cys-tRNA synthase)